MYFCPKSLCNERSYARHARYFAAGNSLRSDTPDSLVDLLMLDVRSSNSMHQPVVRDLNLVKRYAGTPSVYYPVDEDMPIAGVVRPMWQEVVAEKDKDGEQRINRVNYELCVLEALREGLRCR